MAADDYAIVVGIARYPDLGNLQGPENDARNFHTWLTTMGAVPTKQAYLILSSYYDTLDPRPMISDIDSKFDPIIKQGILNRKVGRRLYIYLAGHGFAPNIEEAALLMANAGLGFMGYHIPGRLYARWFITTAFFDEVVLFMDCCRDNYPRARLYTPPWDDIRSAHAAQVRYLYVFATEWSRKSREMPTDSGEVQGLFTRSLLAGLHGPACDEQNRITGKSLKKFVLNYLQKFLPEGKSQEPKFDPDEDESIVLVENLLPLPPTHVKISFGQPPQNGLVELIGPTINDIRPHTLENGTWEIDLERGMYTLFSPGNNQKKGFEVYGEEVLNVVF